MQDIINSINEAELKAAEIKAAAQQKAAKIAEHAEERSAEIARLAEAELKAYREKRIKEAEAEAQKNYVHEITVSRAQASQYCADKLKAAENTVNDIVRRLTRGGH